MITVMQGLPSGVLGLRAEGEVTAADYTAVVVPAIEAAVAGDARASLLYVLDDGAGYDAGALWEDTKVGMHHLSSLDRMAVVTDDGRYRTAVTLMGAFLPGRVKVFGHAELDAATAWAAGTG
ncbi:MAG: STAS/SEC14 domain-containing protein [Frankiales bacterium]|nr:STAS/SEC14 domain-containing protein [Frankiales bacterium]